MDVEMGLRNEDPNSCSPKNQKKKRSKKNKALGGSISATNEGPSLMQDVVLEKDSSTANVSSSCSGLIEDQSNSNMSSSPYKNGRKKEMRKVRKAALKTVNVDIGLQAASEIKPDHLGAEVPVDVGAKPVSEKDLCVESTGNMGFCSGLIEVQSNSDLNIAENKKKRKREEKKRCKALKAVDMDVGLQEVASETKPDPFKVEGPINVSTKLVSDTDLCVESTGKMSSSSGLIEVQSNFDLNISETKKKRKKEKKEKHKASKADNTNVDLQERVSETKTVAFKLEGPDDVSVKSVTENNTCVEYTGNISSSSGLIEVQSNSSLTTTENKKKRKRVEKKRYQVPVDEKIKTVSETAPIEVEVPDDLSKEMDSVATSVEIEAAVDINTKINPIMNSSRLQKKKLKRREKKQTQNSVGHDDNTIFEKDTSPVGVEAPDELIKEMDSIATSVDIEAAVDMNTKISPIKNLSRLQKKKQKRREKKQSQNSVGLDDNTALEKDTSPVEVEVPDLSKEMDSIATSVETEAAVDTNMKINSIINLSRLQKKKLKRREKKQTQNSVGHGDLDHVHPEDNALTKNTLLEKDTSLLSSAIMCLEKQLDGHISLCAEKNEVKELSDGHNESENKDVKFPLVAAGLDLTRVKEELLVPEKQSNYSNIKATSLLEKHDIPAKSVNKYKREKKVKTSSGKKRIKSSNSGENTSDSIKENGTGLASFGHSEAALVTSISENKLAIELERKNDASAQVLEDVMMTEASIYCSDGKTVCKDNENRMKMKIFKEDDENLELRSRDELKEIKITVQGVSNANGVSDENLFRYKEKTSESISTFGTLCNYQKQTNAEVDTKVEEIIPSSSHLGVTKIDVLDDTGKEDNLLQKVHHSPEKACIGPRKRKLLVLDVNGLLADIVPCPPKAGYKPHRVISKKAVFRRPYCDDFLQFCFERFNIGVWSSRIRRNVDAVVNFLMGDLRSNLLFMWDASHCTKTGRNTIENKNKPLVLKELKKLWDKREPNLPWEKGEYNETNTLLLDDSPYKALCNPAHTAIFPYSYQYTDGNDSSLGPGGDLRVYLEGLAAAENVQEYIKQNPFGQQAITESNPFWDFYSKILDTNRSQPHDSSSTSSVAVSNVVSRMPSENTSETAFGSKVTLHQAASASASASETCDNNMVTPMDALLAVVSRLV